MSELSLPEHALTVSSWLTGESQTFLDGRRDRKLATGTIVAAVENGWYEVSQGGGPSQVIRAGQAWLAQDGVALDILHRSDKRRSSMAACWVHFRISLFNTLDVCALLELPQVLGEEPTSSIRSLIQATLVGEKGLVGSAHRAEAAFGTLRALARVARPSPRGRRLLQQAADFGPLAAWAHARLAQPISLGDLAAAAGMSKSRLQARFQEQLGLAPLAWVREMRLLAARDRLLATVEPVAVVGACCGFADPFHFSRAMRARFGVSPTELRRSAQLG